VANPTIYSIFSFITVEREGKFPPAAGCVAVMTSKPN
jgi:hypothetical protein